MGPKSIKKMGDRQLQIVWTDQHESLFTLEQVREFCPCAGCQGETVLFRTYEAPPADRSVPGRYELRNLTLVGSYAMQCEWGDGHATGIYTWERLRASCPCAECLKIRDSIGSTTERGD